MERLIGAKLLTPIPVLLDPDGALSGLMQAGEVDQNSTQALLRTGLEQLLSQMELATQPTSYLRQSEGSWCLFLHAACVL